MRKQFEELHPLFDLEKDEQGEYTCVLTRVTWLGFELGKKTLQAEIDELKHQKSLQELAVNQISQANQEWQRANSEQQKRVDVALQVIFDCRAIGADRIYTCDAVEKTLRGEHENN